MRLTTGAATAAVIRHGPVLVQKEGNEGREKTTATTAQAQHPTTHSNTERERQKNSQPSRFLLTEVTPHPHSSSVPSSRHTCSFLRVHPSFALFIHTFFQKNFRKNIRSPHNSSILSRRRRSVASEFILHPHYSSILYSKWTLVASSRYNVNRVHPSSVFYIHPFPEEHLSATRSILLPEFIPHLHSSSILQKKISGLRVHPASALFTPLFPEDGPFLAA